LGRFLTHLVRLVFLLVEEGPFEQAAMPSLNFLHLLCISLPLVTEAFFGWGSSKEAEGVVQLGSSNFDDHLKTHTKTLVKFYAPWCGHCKEMAPKYEEAEKILRPKGISLVKVDGTEERELGKRFSVDGYPTLIWMEDGEQFPYNGGRGTEDIVDWVTAMTGPVVHEVTSLPPPGKLPQVVLLAKTLDPIYLQAAKSLRTAGKWHFMQDDSKSEMQILHKDEEPVVISPVPSDKAAITQIFDKHSVPYFGVLDGDTYAKYAGKGLLWCLFTVDFAAGGVGAVADEWRPTMTAVAKRFQDKMRVTYTDTLLYKDTIDGMLGVKKFPALVYQPGAGSKAKYIYNGTMTEEAIIAWLDDAIAGNIKPELKSEPVPETNDEPILKIVGSTLETEVYRDDKDVMLEIYAPWCGHCKQLLPEYQKLGKYVKKWKLTDFVTVGQIDGTANDVQDPGLQYDGFPALFFVPAGSKEPIKYDGDRTAKAMWQWMKQKSGRQDDIAARVKEERASKRSEEA